MLRGLVQLIFIGSLLTLPIVAQRGGGFRGGMSGGFPGGMSGGFRGGGFGGPGFRGGFVGRGFHGGYFPRNRFFFGFGFPYWPYYGAGWGYPYYGYTYYPYPTYPDVYPYYEYSYPYPNANQYYGTDQTSCPQIYGQPLYSIKLTYQNKIWVARDYWYTAGTLNFVTPDGKQNKTPIDSIDRALTFQLNRDCGLAFQFYR